MIGPFSVPPFRIFQVSPIGIATRKFSRKAAPFISHYLSLASSAHTLEDHISLTDSCRNELRLWISFLKQWNRLTFFLTKCISTLHKGYHSIHAARTLDAMFILAFFGFLRCSE
ncbi:proline and serine-rich 1-like protein [Labeo rohita]|uniref:Proline and serine-rich 1-like protein n=1 Tax=Labeo rohita TaxID=84645 RepID=A0A498LVW5_LABRO|nr:proline and serine-rich 1-like protein [Labeo rohita]